MTDRDVTVNELEKMKAHAEFIRNRFIAHHNIVVTDEVHKIVQHIERMMGKLWTDPHNIYHDKVKKLLEAE